MAIRVSGLISGLDTDSIVQELVSAYSTKKEKYEKAQTKQEWKMDAWKTMNSKIYGFYTSSLSNMRMSTAYSLKTSSVSNSNVATVTASSSAVNGTQKMKVNKLASSAYMTGGVVKLSDDKNNTGDKKVTGSTALSDMGIEAGSKIAVNDKEIEIKDGMTVNQLVAKLKDAGVNASFDETNQRFFVNAKTSGADGEFTLTANNFGGLNAIQSLGLFATKDTTGEPTAEMKKYEAILSDDTIDADDERKRVANAVVNSKSYTSTELADYEDTVKAYEKNAAFVKQYESSQKIVDAYLEQSKIVEDYNTKLDPDDENSETKLDKVMSLLTKDTVTDDDGIEAKVMYTDKEIAAMKEFVAKVDAGEISKADTDDDGNNNGDTYANYKEIIAAKEEYDTYQNAVAYTKKNDSSYKSASAVLAAVPESEYENIRDNEVNDQTKIDAYNKAKSAVAANSVSSYDGDAARISGQDAEIVLNGATFTSSTGTFSINGLSITAMQVTGADEEVSITTSNDTQAMYDKIKEFIGKYNELIKEMDTAYNAASAGDYEPLTDDEKENMSDKEIEKWETKIKDSLLRRDSTLGNTSSAMKSKMNASFEINGKTYSLASFGIATGSYFTSSTDEKGCLHIDGDKDDSTTSGNTDKLMAAINEDPETVAAFFQKLSTSVYDDLTKRMASSSVSSVYTIYNDKQMSSEYSEYKDKVDKWQEKLEYYEEFYYKKFSSMESALSKLQSSTSSLSNLLGS